MNAVLFEWKGLFNGSLMDCLDLCLFCKINKIPLTFCVLNCDDSFMSAVRCVYEERGYNNYISFDKLDIVPIDKLSIHKYKKIVIFDYTTLMENLIFLSMSEVTFVSNILKTETNSFVVNREKYKNVTVLCEKSYNMYGDVEYRQKYIKPLIEKTTENTLVVFPTKMSNKHLIRDTLKKVYAVEISDDWLVRFGSNHLKMWGRFNRLLYFQSLDVYDRKPRILLECRMCGIGIDYHRLYNRVDGSVFRMDDTLLDREYTLNDILIGRLV